jgi:dihydrodipicolinate synthase/N-acetylneuraminate lyase
MLVAHCAAIDSDGGLPFLVYGGPGDRSCCRQLPSTMAKVALACPNLVGWKIASRGISQGENSFADCVAALRQAEESTGRPVAALVAGDADLCGVLDAGAAGNINACESIRVEDNTAIYKAFRAGDHETAHTIQRKIAPIPKVIYGMGIGRSFTYFHYRFKIATWMLGRIHNPYMRLPQVPPPDDEIVMIHDALTQAGKTVVHEPTEFHSYGAVQAAAE